MHIKKSLSPLRICFNVSYLCLAWTYDTQSANQKRCSPILMSLKDTDIKTTCSWLKAPAKIDEPRDEL